MKKIFFILLMLNYQAIKSQDVVEVYLSELEYVMSNDSTSRNTSLDEKLLNGKYKMIDDSFPSRYSVLEFIDGKAEGKSKTYIDDVLIGTSEFKNGLPNGLAVLFENKGETVLARFYMINGKLHGKAWFHNDGDKYYIMDKEATKEEY